jgi:hypothetical protein
VTVAPPRDDNAVTTEEHLMQLAHLKRDATTLDGLDRYSRSLYRAAATWAPEAPPGITILVIDAIIDGLAHDHDAA